MVFDTAISIIAPANLVVSQLITTTLPRESLVDLGCR